MGFIDCLLLLFASSVSVHFVAAVGPLGHQMLPQVPTSASSCTSWPPGPLLLHRGWPVLPSLLPIVSPGCIATCSPGSAAWVSGLEAAPGKPACRGLPSLHSSRGTGRRQHPADCPTSCAALSINLMGSLYRQDSWLGFFWSSFFFKLAG